MVAITGLEYAYTHAPRSLKSLTTSLWVLTIAAANFGLSLLNGSIARGGWLAGLHGANFYWFSAGLMAVNVTLFALVAARLPEKIIRWGRTVARYGPVAVPERILYCPDVLCTVLTSSYFRRNKCLVILCFMNRFRSLPAPGCWPAWRWPLRWPPRPKKSRVCQSPANAFCAIREGDIKRDLFALAGDHFRGREGGTLDELKASVWLADQIRATGMLPAGDDGTYFQWFNLQRTRLTKASTLRIGTHEIKLNEDGAVTAPTNASINAPLVYVGTGSAAELGQS